MKKSITKELIIKYKWAVALRILICIINRGCFLLLPLIFGTTINHIAGGNYTAAIHLVIIGMVVGVLAKVSQICKVYAFHNLTLKLTNEYTALAGERLFDDSKKEKHGEILNVITADIDTMSYFVPRMTRMVIRCLEIMIIFIYFFMVGYYFGFAAISATAFSLMILNISKNKITAANQNLLESGDMRFNLINKVITKRKSKEEPTKELLLHYANEFAKGDRKKEITEATVQQYILALIELFRWGTVFMGIYLYINGSIEIGVIVILYSYFGSLKDGSEEFSAMIIRIKQWQVSKQRFMNFCQIDK